MTISFCLNWNILISQIKLKKHNGSEKWGEGGLHFILYEQSTNIYITDLNGLPVLFKMYKYIYLKRKDQIEENDVLPIARFLHLLSVS